MYVTCSPTSPYCSNLSTLYLLTKLLAWFIILTIKIIYRHLVIQCLTVPRSQIYAWARLQVLPMFSSYSFRFSVFLPRFNTKHSHRLTSDSWIAHSSEWMCADVCDVQRWTGISSWVYSCHAVSGSRIGRMIPSLSRTKHLLKMNDLMNLKGNVTLSRTGTGSNAAF